MIEMNITIISPFENFLTKRGNRHPFLANLLVKSRYNVKYISSNFYHAEKRSFSKKEIIKAQKNRLFNQVFLSVPGYQSNYSLSRIITHLIFSLKVFFYLIFNPSPDLVLIPSRPSEMIFLVTIAKFLKKFKLIIDVRDIWPDGFPSRGFLYVLFFVYCNLFQYLSVPSQKNFIFTSPMFLKWIFRYQKNCNPRFITLGYDKDRWIINKPLTKIDEVKKIVYIGNIDQTMNFYPLIDGIKESKNWSLTFIGGGDNIEETKKYIKDNNIKNVFFKGFIDKLILPSLLTKYHMSVIPMIEGTMPNKLFDSIGSYLPILSFGENDVTKFVRTNDIGWILKFNKDDVVKFLIDIKTEEIINKSKNIKKIREQYSKEYLYNQFVEYIDIVLQ
jgi:hypothetical protein